MQLSVAFHTLNVLELDKNISELHSVSWQIARFNPYFSWVWDLLLDGHNSVIVSLLQGSPLACFFRIRM